MSSKKGNKQFTKVDFLKFLREAVMFSPIPEGDPKDVFCKRLNTFAITNANTDLKLETFGINSQVESMKELYFQRSKKHKFPALIVSMTTGRVEDKGSNKKKQCFNFEIGVIDKLIKDCKNCGYCGKRNDFEIRCDTNELLNQACEYLEQICCARGYTEETITNRDRQVKTGKKIYTSENYEWVSKPVLKHVVKESETLSGYDVDVINTARLQQSIRDNNKNTIREEWFYPPNYHGTWTNISVCENLECIERDWNVGEFNDKINILCC